MHKNEITKTHPKRQIKVLNGHVSYCVPQQDDSQEGKWKCKNTHHWCSAGARQSDPASRISSAFKYNPDCLSMGDYVTICGHIQK